MTQNMNSAAVSDRGLSKKRPQNEDSFLELPAHGLFAVADGVGGAQAGDVASQMAMELLGEAFSNSRNGDVEDLMKLAIERANGAIYQMSHDLKQLSTMATTIVAVHIADNIATIGHVGDSRLYRVDPRGNLFRETQDHSVVEEEVRAGRMTPAQAAYHPSKNVISRALGADSTVQVDMKTIMFEPNTSFLLCSDGITRHIEDHEIRELLRQGKAPSEVCEEMKYLCYQRGAEDNLTAVIIHIGGEGALVEDEDTIARARPAIVSNEAFAPSELNTVEIPTQELQMPAENFQPTPPPPPSSSDDQNIAAETTGDFADKNSLKIPPSAEINNYQAAQNDKIFAVEETSSSSSGIGKLIAGLVLGLLIGALIGAAAYNYMFKPQPQPVQETPKITEMQTPNISYSAFEDNRRNVDRDPAKYIAANSAAPKDAEDNYLLGRAYLLSEKYVEAKDSFTKAKDLLPQESNADRTMLGNEIAIGLSIVDSSFSKQSLKAARKDIGLTTDSNPNSNANTNSNMATKPANN